MPGTDVRETLRVVLGELPDLPHLPELPARGAGADLVGRTLSLLPDLAATTVPTGWRVSATPGADLRRAASWLEQDLDTLEELAAGWSGPFKVQLAGPLTVAAQVELASGERLLRDHGARRDVAAALAEAVRTHLADLRRRVPDAVPLLQLDEPSLPAVLAGRVRTASGWRTLRAVDGPEVRDLLGAVTGAAHDAGADVVVHSCAPAVPVRLLREAGADAVSLDAALLTEDEDEPLGEAVESGARLFLGVVPTTPTQPVRPSDSAATVAPVIRLWRRLGLSADSLARSVVPTPACGLAAASPDAAREALTRVRATAGLLADPPEVPA